MQHPLKQGAGLHQDTQIGPLVSKEQHERVLGYIEKGKSEGATAVVGGDCPYEAGYFVSPTVFKKRCRR
ncbi:aldehyde dehydrogenase family protein [Bacillus sp. SL00103]